MNATETESFVARNKIHAALSMLKNSEPPSGPDFK